MILVTGGSGFIGSHLVEHLAESGRAVRCLVRRKAARRKAKNRLPAGVETACGDLATGEGLREALEGAHTVIHLAGVTAALRAGDYYTGNTRAAGNLVHALAGRPVRLVHVSSLAAIGASRNGCPVDEDALPQPITHYGKSKLEAERLVRELAPQAVIVRPPVVYGPRDTGVFQLLRAISRGLVLQIAGGERWFSAIYVKDLVEGLLAAAESSRAAGRTYFMAYAKPASWTQFSSVAAGIMGRNPRVLRVPAPVAHAIGFGAEVWSQIVHKPGIVSREKVAEARCTSWICDSRRAAAELGFAARTSLEEGLAETLAWYKEAGWLTY